MIGADFTSFLKKCCLYENGFRIDYEPAYRHYTVFHEKSFQKITIGIADSLVFISFWYPYILDATINAINEKDTNIIITTFCGNICASYKTGEESITISIDKGNITSAREKLLKVLFERIDI